MKQIPHKNYLMKIVENTFNMPIEEILRIKYVDENKSLKQISKEINVSYATIWKWLQQAGIYSRKLNI